MSYILECAGLKRPYPMDRERRRLVMIELAKRGMTITDLAKKLMLPISLISMVINGRRRSPKTEKRIAVFLGKTREALFPPRTPEEIRKMRGKEAASKRGAA